jgi:enamine deaminase RidA (YjgF/YER057c/UK114 family)
MNRQTFESGTPWEPVFGYSRVVRVGQFVYVSGTTATDNEGNIVGVGDSYLQTVQILKNIKFALERAGTRLEDVVRTRVYTTNIDDWDKIAQAHGEVFKGIKPASAIVEVKRLVSPAMLVEIEADAVVEEGV